MNFQCFLLSSICLLSGLVHAQSPVYLNDQNITVALGASMAADPFQNVSTEQSLINIIDAPTAGSGEDHNQATHVWVSGGPLELDFDLGQEYDLRLVHFWNYLAEGFDVDDLDLTFYDTNRNLVGRVLDVEPAIGGGGSNPIFAETITLSFPSGIRYINAVLSGSNGQVDFNNMGFTGIPSNEVDIPRVVESYINHGNPQRSMIQSVGVRFDRNAFNRLTKDALRVQNIATGEMVDLSGTEVLYDPRNNSASWFFDRDVNALLVDGNYIAWLARDNFIGATERASCGLNPPPLDDFVFSFHQYAGDSDGDRDVDFKDSCVFRDTWQQTVNNDRYYSYFDFDLSNLVAENDRLIVNSNYFNILPPIPALHLFLRNDTGTDLADLKTSRYNLGATAIDLPDDSFWFLSIDSTPFQSVDDFVAGSSLILGESTIDQLNGGALAIGDHTMRVEIRRSDDTLLAFDEFTFEYLGNVPCGPYFISTPPSGVSLGQIEGAQPLNLSNWSVEQWNSSLGPPRGQQPANWVIAPDGLSVEQVINAAPSALMSSDSLLNVRITGGFRVDTASDDDFMGFIFGFQNQSEFYLFDWKQNAQSGAGKGMSIKRVNIVDLDQLDLWSSGEDNGDITILSPPNDIGWENFQDYEITLDLTPGKIVVEVNEEGVLLARLEVDDETFAGGRFGFYNHSQDSVIYRGFTQEALNNLYFYDAEALDPDGGTVSYALANNDDGSAPPAGATVNATTGALIWQPEVPGTFPFTIVATDNDNLTDVQSFQVLVTPVDLPPVVDLIKTAPSILPGEPISFQVRATDDQQLFRVRLFIDDLEVPLDGTFNYTTSFDQIGTVELRAVAIDSAEQVTSVTSYVRVLDPNAPNTGGQNSTPIAPPGQSSGSPTDLRPLVSFQAPTAATDDPTSFIGTADSNGGDFGQWFFEWAPAAKVDFANLASPSVLWQELGTGTDELAAQQFATITPGDFPNELIAFRLRAENTNGLGAIASIVFNPQSTSNSGPTVETGAGAGPPALASFTSPLTVSDDRSLIRGTIDANGGTLQSWVLDFAPRNQVDTANLSDPAVAWSILAQGISPGADQLLATLDPASFSSQTYVFRLTARNSDGAGTVASLIYNPVAEGFSGPEGTTGINPGNAQRPVCRINSPQASTDDRSMLLGSILANGGSLQNWIVDYTPRTQVNPNDLSDPSVAWTVLAEGSDEKTSELITPLTAADFNAGTWIIRLRAFNQNGLGCLASIQLDTGDMSVPAVAILTPAAEEDIDFISDATGTVSAGDGVLDSWKLELASTSEVSLANLNASANWVELGSGTTEVSEDVIGMIDPTGLQNGSYVLRLSARNTNGRGIADGIIIYVCGEAKLGNFRLEFEDLNIPLAGIPIRINRIYDTLNANRSGDFGFGWTLGIGDPDLRETVPDNGDSYFFPNPFEIGTRVFLTTPDGRRVGFTFNVRNPRNRFLYVDYEPYFEPDPGVYETLTIAPGDFQRVEVDAAGAVYTPLIPFGFNPENYRLTTKEGLTYHINQRTGLQFISDLNGQRVDFSRDKITHSSGVQIAITRDSRNRITHISDPDGAEFRYLYDSNGNLIGVQDPKGGTTRLTYLARPSHFLESIANPVDDAAGRLTQQVIYEDGRFARVIDANGNPVSSQQVDPTNFTGSRTDALGNITTLVYNERGNITQVTSPGGQVSEFEYNDPANPDRETAFTDGNGNRTEVAYDTRGNPVRITDAAGLTRDTVFNSGNRPTSLTMRDSSGVEIYTVRAEYDTNNNLTKFVNCSGLERIIEYDDKGRATSIIDFDGKRVNYGYASDGSSEPSTVSNTDGETNLQEYDASGRLTRATSSDGSFIRYAYNAAGQMISQTDDQGNSINVTYDLNGNPTRIVDADGGITLVEYDGFDRATREIKVVTDDGDNSNDLATTITYDANGRTTSVTDPAGRMKTYEYNIDGQLIATIDSSNRRTSFSYDDNGNLIEVIDRLGRRTTYSYDYRNIMIAENWFEPGGTTPIKTISQQIDDRGRTTRLSDNQSNIHYEYECASLSRIHNTGSNGVPLFDFSVTSDSAQRIKTITDASGAMVERSYDSDGLLAQLQWEGGGLPGVSVGYRRDEFGFPVEINRYSNVEGSSLVSQTRVTREPIEGSITSIQHLGPENNLIHPASAYDFGLSLDGKINAITSSIRDVSFQYDSQGQLTDSVHRIAGFDDEFYRYDELGNRTDSHLGGTTTIDDKGLLASNQIYTYTYDNENNRITDVNLITGESRQYTYDHRNRLTSITVEDSSANQTSSTTFIYDPLDRLIGRETNGNAEFTIYFDENPWADVTEDGTALARYLYDDTIDGLIARWDSSTGIEWLLTDQRRSVRQAVDNNGNITAQITYDSFGNPIAGEADLLRIRFGFTGREYLGGNLHHFRKRVYDSFTGRFLSDDPIGISARDFNLQRYVFNDPLRRVDPTGEFSVLGFTISFSITGTLRAAGTLLAGVTIRGVLVNAVAGAVLAPLIDMLCLSLTGQSDRIGGWRAFRQGIIGLATGALGGALGSALKTAALASKLTPASGTIASGNIINLVNRFPMTTGIIANWLTNIESAGFAATAGRAGLRASLSGLGAINQGGVDDSCDTFLYRITGGQ